jgi:hypothetical protein
MAVKAVPRSTPHGAGWYPFGVAGTSAEWDGQAWTGATHVDPEVPEPPKWHHRPFAFLGHKWFWFMVVGNLLVVGAAFVVMGTKRAFPGWFLVVAGMAVFMAGVVYLLDRHQKFGEVEGQRVLMWCGLGSGLVAVFTASLLESGGLETRIGLPLGFDLWLAGPVEETCKLAIPFLLLVFGGRMFKDPRGGFMMVMFSGIVFGAVEAAEYIASPKEWLPFMMAVERPVGELLHPFLTAFAAAVIWLAAWRAGKAFTWIGAGAWVVAMAIHSLHDGMFSPFEHGDQLTSPAIPTATLALEEGVEAFVFGLIWAVIIYLVMRHTSRELVPPDAVATNAPHWRPQIKQWGAEKTPEAADHTA